MIQMEIIADFRPIISNAFIYKYRYLSFLTGRMGLAKSTNISKALLIVGLMKPLRILCARQTMSSIKDSVHAQLCNIIRAYDLPYVIYNDTIKAPNGTTFIFKGLQETGIHNIRSMTNIDICWLEEGQSVSKESWESLVPTIRTKGSYIIVSANPDEESDIVQQMFGPEAERRDDTYTCYKDFRYNPFLLPRAILHDIYLMKKNRPADYDSIYLGHIKKATDHPVVKSWNPNLNIGVGKRQHTIIWSLDFNVNPQCSVICHWDGAHDFYFSDEIVLENAPTQQVAEEFVRLYREKYADCYLVINGDASGQNRSSNSMYSNYAIIEQVLTAARIRFTFDVPRRNTSIANRVSNFDWHILGLDGKPHILIDPECAHLIHACKLLGYDENGKIIETPARPGMKTIDYAKSHIFDAASYCVMINDPVVETFLKSPKPVLTSIKEMWEQSLRKTAKGGASV